LLFYPDNSPTPSSWGFLAETAQEQGAANGDVREWFKILLDEGLLEKMRQKTSDPTKVVSIRDVEKWFVFSPLTKARFR
jgi:hypothetical protein